MLSKPELLSTGCAEFEWVKQAIRRSRAVRASPAIERTAIDGSMPETHLSTDSDDVESVTSSGFLRMFAQDNGGRFTRFPARLGGHPIG